VSSKFHILEEKMLIQDSVLIAGVGFMAAVVMYIVAGDMGLVSTSYAAGTTYLIY